MGLVKAKAKELRHIINATFPNYKRRDVYIDARGTVNFHNLNWDGGSRNVYRACTVDGRPVDVKVNMNGPAPWNNPFEGKSVEIPEGAVIVQGGTFCGKDSLLYIHCNPANMPKFIPEHV